jgi:hypothetical protein
LNEADQCHLLLFAKPDKALTLLYDGNVSEENKKCVAWIVVKTVVLGITVPVEATAT